MLCSGMLHSACDEVKRRSEELAAVNSGRECSRTLQ